ncbi:MAG: putative DNA-binding protein [Candidatus Berkelbacteria bacterium Athens1014_28]|uniref:Putative DNA-binding protein n=1 Tax=Candidatus Berkelbacteria bacterium Athens1014_28 TaxID=2017145 RepID=A0A554LNI2_9BACT|nr:MAG: putative DNA-binding protein [Candidatus Berkelbacteria bacterium Athens1014_28]
MKNEIEIYSGKRGVEIKVKFEKETVWLTVEQIAELFATQRPAITKHLKNIYNTKELNEDGTCSVLEHMGGGEKQKRQYQTKIYNLDVIISVGYRVNSKKATEFRVWATGKLKNYLFSDYLTVAKRLITGLTQNNGVHASACFQAS